MTFSKSLKIHSALRLGGVAAQNGSFSSCDFIFIYHLYGADRTRKYEETQIFSMSLRRDPPGPSFSILGGALVFSHMGGKEPLISRHVL